MTGIYVQTQEEGAAGGTLSGNGYSSTSVGTCSVKGPLLGCNRCWQRRSVQACTHSPLSAVHPVMVSLFLGGGGEHLWWLPSLPSTTNLFCSVKQGGPVSSPVNHITVCTACVCLTASLQTCQNGSLSICPQVTQPGH